MKELEPLRAVVWREDHHRHQLEDRIMQQHSTRSAPLVLTRARALAAGVALALLGGIAGATAASIVHSWNGKRLEFTPLSGGQTRMHVSEESSGDVLLDTVLEYDEGVIAIDDGGEDELIVVTPVAEEN